MQKLDPRSRPRSKAKTMDPSSSRPDLNWTPYSINLPPPPSAYLHVIVVEATSARHPKPGASRTALYTVAVLPSAPLEVGRCVHLHLLCSSVPGDVVPANMDRAVAVPLAVAGPLAGVRMHHTHSAQGELQGGGEEIEFVLKNEIAEGEAGVGRAFVRVRYVPGVSARVSLAGALEERTPDNGREGLLTTSRILPKMSGVNRPI